jgi:hypothetical protein
MILFALSGAQESAKADKTRATINKLNSLVMAKYESYRTRRVPITIPRSVYIDTITGNPIPKAMQTAAGYRVDAIRDLMRMEMPDRITDIVDNPVTHSIAGDTTSPLIPVPSVTIAYRANIPASVLPGEAYENAKCLYLLVSMGLDDPDVMSQFSDDEIVRDPNDGMRYFVDGWGQPIYFIRWAPGFNSPLQPWNVNGVDALGNTITAKTYPTTHDPLDPLRTHVPSDSSDPFFNPTTSTQVYPPLYPLIFSGGPDRITDIYATSNSPPFEYSKTSPYPNNPYVFVNGSWSSGGLFGMPSDLPSIFTPSNITNPTGDGVDNSIDNITNQDLSETQ